MLTNAQIERKAKELLERTNILVPSVDPERVAGQLGISVLRTKSDDDGISGALYRVRSKSLIGVNESHSPTRQRFTVAHELGHWILHNDEIHYDMQFFEEGPTRQREQVHLKLFNRDKTSSSATDPKEIEANRFAAALLMPIHFLRASIKQHEFSPPLSQSNISTLAREYEVSLQAMTFRLINLGAPIEIAGDEPG